VNFDVQGLAITGSILFLLLIARDLRKRTLQPQYSVLWLVLGAGVLVLSIWRDGLERLSHLIGVYYPPAALFLVLFLVLFLLAHHLTREASRANHGLRKVVQEAALLRLEVEELREALASAGTNREQVQSADDEQHAGKVDPGGRLAKKEAAHHEHADVSQPPEDR
jgi:hypothetical protein